VSFGQRGNCFFFKFRDASKFSGDCCTAACHGVVISGMTGELSRRLSTPHAQSSSDGLLRQLLLLLMPMPMLTGL